MRLALRGPWTKFCYVLGNSDCQSVYRLLTSRYHRILRLLSHFSSFQMQLVTYVSQCAVLLTAGLSSAVIPTNFVTNYAGLNLMPSPYTLT